MNRSDPRADYPPRRQGLYLLAVLMLACLLSFLDRTLLTLLAPPVKAALRISDSQLGLLQGFAFALFYSVLAMPFGWLTDRINRRGIVVFGVVLWSMATVGCGLARNFPELALARGLVGCGEASLMPAAYSLLADSFPPNQRGRVFGAFMAMVYAGGGGALIIGGAVLRALKGVAVVSLPLVGAQPVWKAAFMLVGAPGLLVALLALTLREPARRQVASGAARDGEAFFSYARRHAPAFACVWGAYALLSYVAYGVIPWAPTLLVRRLGLPLPQVGLGVGLSSLVAGLAGAAVSGALGDRWTTKGARGGKFRLTLVWWAAALPVIALFAFARSAPMAFLAYAGFSFFNAVGYVSASAVIQDMVPSTLRGRTTAFWYLVTGLLGNGLGPVATGLVTDGVFHSEAALPQAMLTMAIPGVLLGAACTGLGLRAYDRARAEAAGLARDAPPMPLGAAIASEPV